MISVPQLLAAPFLASCSFFYVHGLDLAILENQTHLRIGIVNKNLKGSMNTMKGEGRGPVFVPLFYRIVEADVVIHFTDKQGVSAARRENGTEKPKGAAHGLGA